MQGEIGSSCIFVPKKMTHQTNGPDHQMSIPVHNNPCPSCGSLQHYTLQDNRLQCAACRKKYTVGSQRSKLSPLDFQHIADSFWQMTPAAAAATIQGLNSKTLQKYYDLIRRTISETNEERARKRFGTATINPAFFFASAAGKGLGSGQLPLFCVAQVNDEIVLLFPQALLAAGTCTISGAAIVGWVYAKDNSAFTSLDISRIHFMPAAEGTDEKTYSSFWIYAKRGLVTYHGGFRKNFRLFMHEMEFRFNHRTKAVTPAFLLDILQGNIKNTGTGDENAPI
jgi:transposase